jgi:hypothetical protein
MRGTEVRSPPRRKASVPVEREERLRKAHARAQTLRSAFPSASLVKVHLQFLPAGDPPHAAQSFQLYPGARMFFDYPCPYGGCDGVFELGTEADRTLMGDKPSVSGVLECGGHRARDGLPHQPCGLRMNYKISARHEPPSPA